MRLGLLSSRRLSLCCLRLLLAVPAIGLLMGGCASYSTPGRGADMTTFGVNKDVYTDGAIIQSLAKQPLASFPAGIAVARVQAPGYQSMTTQGWGAGRYSLVTTRDIEKDEQIERLSMQPMVHGIAPINRLLLPSELKSDLELRQAAAALHADMLLIYTLDTTFEVDDKIAPLTVLTLGLSPNQQARVNSTASAVLMDTRNGYIYGAAEGTSRDTQMTSAWTSNNAVDETRRRVESAAFEKLVSALEKTWAGVVRTYARGGAPAIEAR